MSSIIHTVNSTWGSQGAEKRRAEGSPDSADLFVGSMTPAELDELIQTHSLLNDSSAVDSKEVLHDLLAAVFGDAFTRGTSRSLSPQAACQSLLSFLREVGEKDCSAFISQLEQMLESFNLQPIEHIRELEQLAPGKRYQINHGWISKTGGHCVVFEFERVDAAYFNFTVYNLGEGSKYHPRTSGGYKSRTQSWLHFQNLPVEQLFYCQPGDNYKSDFIIALLGRAKLAEMVKAEDLYEALLHHLTPYLVAEEDTKNFMTPQRDGNCTWKTLRAVMRRWLGKQLDKRMMFFVKQSILVNRFYTLFGQSNKSVSKKERYLLRMSAHKFMTTIAKRLKAGSHAVSLEEAKIGWATAYDLLRRLDSIEKSIHKEIARNIGHLPKVPKGDSDLQTLLQKNLCRQQQPTPATNCDCETPSASASISLELLCPPKFNHNPTFFLSHLKQLNKNTTPISEVYAYLNAFPLLTGEETDFWNQVHKPQECLDILSEMLTRLISKEADKSFFAALPLPHRVNGGLAVLAMINELAQRIDREADNPLQLAQYGMIYPGYARRNLNTEIFLDPRDFERRCEIDAYFAHYKGGCFGDYKPQFQKVYSGPSIGYRPTKGTHTLLATIMGQASLKEVLLSNPKIVQTIGINRYDEDSYLAAYLITDNGLHILKTYGYGHVAQLIEMSLKARAAYEGRLHKTVCPTQIKYKLYFRYRAPFTVGVASHQHPVFTDKKNRWGSGIKLYSLPQAFPHSLRLMGEPFSSIKRETGEALGLKTFRPPDFPIDLRKLVHTRSEPTLTVPQLLHFEQRMDRNLNEREERILFDLHFFRRYYSETHHECFKQHFPALEALQKRGVYFEQAVAFITNGMKGHIEDVEGHKPNVERALFYVRLRSNIARLLRSEEELPSTDSLLNSLELRKDLTADELRAVMFNKVYSHCWKGDDVAPGALKEILEAWMIFKQQPLYGSSFYPYLEAHAIQFVQRLLVNYYFAPISLEVVREVCEKVTERLGLSPVACKEVKAGAFPIYRMGDDEHWREFDLFSGEIREKEGVIGVMIDFPSSDCWIIFQELFGRRKHCYRQEGEMVCFSDSIYGEVRYKNNRFYCQINGSWMSFVPRSETALPPILNECYCTWALLDGEGGFYLTHPKSCEVHYYVTAEGKIFESKRDIEVLTIAEEENIVFQFADYRHILCHKLTRDQMEMQLPFYQTLAGQPLKFRSNRDGELIWEGHSRFRLAPYRWGVCGTYPHYLLLEECEGEREKVLIPCTPLLSSEAEVKQIALAWSSSKPIPYIECELDAQGQLTTVSVEGKLYLALILLEQKRYREALEYLEQIEPTHRATPLAEELLEQIINLQEINRDNSSNRAAICLKAYFCAARFFTAGDRDVKGLQQSLLSAYITYCTSVHTRDSELNLTPEESLYYERCYPSRSYARLLPMNIKSQPVSITSFWKIRISNRGSRNETKHYDQWIEAPKQSEEKLVAVFAELSLENWNVINHFWVIYAKIRSISWAPGEWERVMLWLGIRIHKIQQHTKQESVLLRFLEYALSPNSLLPPPPKYNDDSWWENFVSEYNANRVLGRMIWSNSGAYAYEPKQSLVPSDALSKKSIALSTYTPLRPMEPLPEEIGVKCKKLQKMCFEKKRLDYPLPLPLEIKPDLLDEIEKEDFQGIVEREIRATNDLLVLGKDTLDARPIYQPNGDLKVVRQELDTLVTSLEEQISAHEKELLALANKMPQEEDKCLVDMACRAGLVWDTLSIRDLQWLFLEGSAEAFCAANQNLSLEEARMLYEMLAHYLNLQVQLQRIKRSQNFLHRYQNGTSEKEKVYVANLLAQELGNTRHYNPHEHPIFLLFEYLSGFRLRPQQADLLKKIIAGDAVARKSVFQMMMGGGKTSVLATILSAMAASRGAYSLVVVPPALRTSVRENLRGSLRNSFNRSLVELTVKREEVDLDKIREFQKLLDHTLEHKEVILTTADDLAALRLKFTDFIYDQVMGGDVKREIRELGDILEQLYTNGSAFADECDILFSALRKLIFTIGDSERMHKQRIHLLREIDRLIIDDSYGIRDSVKVQKNEQARLAPDVYHENIVPRLAEMLSYYSPLRLSKGEKKAFIRYVSGKMNAKALSEEDSDFLLHLEQRSLSKLDKDRESYHLIALSKYVLTTLLPTTLSKEGGRHYGRTLTGQTGKVIPYLAVDTPATTEFGNHWEGIFYQFQTALQSGIELQQVKAFVELLFSEAYARVKRSCNKIAFKDTPEAQYFYEKLKLSLKAQYTQEELEELQTRINKIPELVLILEGWTVEQVVTHFPKKTTCTAQAVIDMIPSWIAMSGTPDNAIGYDPDFEILRDRAAEAQIAVKLLNDLEENPHALHEVTTTEPATLLSEALQNHPTPEKVRCLLDSGGFFKEYDNETVARALLAELQNRDPTIEGILFFNRVGDEEEKKQAIPDTLCALKSPEGLSLVIGPTGKKDIEKVGLRPENYFTFYDERHTTGTDIPQLFDTIGLLTCDERSLTSRVLYQTALRLRERLGLQTTEYIIHESMIAKIPDGRALFLSSLKNQAIKLCKEEFARASKDMIDNVFKSAVFSLLREHRNDVSAVVTLFKAFQTFLVEESVDKPAQQFGKLDQKVPSVHYLLSYGEKKTELFKQCCERCSLVEAHIPSSAEERLEKVYKVIYENRERLQKEVLAGDSEAIGITQEIKLQLEEENENEKEIELQLELENYLNPNKTVSVKVENATLETISMLINELATCATYDNIAGTEGIGKYENHRYIECFSSDLRLSSGFAHPFHEAISLFDPLYRPAGQLLIVKHEVSDSYRGVLLSEYEAALCKTLIDDDEANVGPCWLVQSDGSSLLESRPNVLEDESILQLLINTAVLNSDFAFLLSSEIEEALINWIMCDRLGHRQKQRGELQNLRIRLLKLKTHENPTAFRRLNYLLDCYFSDSSSELINQILNGINCLDMQDIAYYQRLTSDDVAEVVRLPKRIVNQLLPTQVPLLSETQLGWLETPALIRAVAPEHIRHISLDAITSLLPEQLKALAGVAQIQCVAADLLHHIDPEQMVYLSRSQILALNPDSPNHLKVIAHFSNDQLHMLPPTFAPYLPPEYVALLDPAQHKEVIAHLKKNVVHLETNEQLAAINLAHIGYLRDEQLDALEFAYHNDLICHFLFTGNHREKVGKRAEPWIAHLNDMQIPQLHNAYLTYLDASSAPVLSKQQVCALDCSDLIQHLGENTRFLTTQEQIQMLLPRQFNWIEKESLIHLSERQLGAVNYEQHRDIIEYFLYQGDFLKKIGKKRAIDWIARLDDEEFNQLHNAYLSCLEPQNIGLLHVDRLNPYYISQVSLNQLRHIRNLQLLNVASAYQKLSMNFPQMCLLDSKVHQIAWVFSRLAMAIVIAAAIAYAVNYSHLTGGIVTIGALLATYQWRYYVIPMELEGQIDVQLPAV